ncbi:hypothetical protein MHTCC0001_37130 [Flavobacteriaceae bacterium MHTCC 0001]
MLSYDKISTDIVYPYLISCTRNDDPYGVDKNIVKDVANLISKFSNALIHKLYHSE